MSTYRTLRKISGNTDFSDVNIRSLSQAERKELLKQKLKNLDIIREKIQVKIADLGFARELDIEDLTNTQCGTPLIMAPEVIHGKRYNHKADVWSLGVVFFEMLTGFFPFNGSSKDDLKRNLLKGDYKLPKKIKLSLEGLDFLNCCL